MIDAKSKAEYEYIDDHHMHICIYVHAMYDQAHLCYTKMLLVSTHAMLL